VAGDDQAAAEAVAGCRDYWGVWGSWLGCHAPNSERPEEERKITLALLVSADMVEAMTLITPLHSSPQSAPSDSRHRTLTNVLTGPAIFAVLCFVPFLVLTALGYGIRFAEVYYATFALVALEIVDLLRTPRTTRDAEPQGVEHIGLRLARRVLSWIRNSVVLFLVYSYMGVGVGFGAVAFAWLFPAVVLGIIRSRDNSKNAVPQTV
jgi:hypothetical protein